MLEPRRRSSAIFLAIVTLAGCSRKAAPPSSTPQAAADPFASAYTAGRFEEAERIARDRLSQRPEDGKVRADLGAVLARRERWEEAERELREAVRRVPEYPLARFNLGTVLAARKLYAEAIEEYRSALSLDPELTGAHVNLGNALLRVGKGAEAEPSFRRALELDPTSPEARQGEIVALSLQGRYTRAMQRTEEGRRAFPDLDVLILAQARLLAASPDGTVRDGRRALALLAQQTTRVGAVTVPAAEALAMAHAETGAYDEAVRWQERALEATRSKNLDGSFLEATLAEYRAGRPCRRPWPELPPGPVPKAAATGRS